MTKTKAPWPAHALAKLASSGLDEADARELQLDYLTVDQVAQLYEDHELNPALRFPYFNPATGEGFTDLPGRPPFYRLRFFRPPSAFGEKEAGNKYTNESGFPPHAYFPTLPTVDWPAVLANPHIPLLITEGELKAACATKHEFPTIGLGGVSSFGAKKRGIEFLPELEAVNWQGRRAYIAFDSDAVTNKDVKLSENRLTALLSRRGAKVRVLRLPDVYDDGRKTGLDDLLVESGPDALAELLETSRKKGEAPAAHASLFKLNEELVYILTKGFCVHQRTHDLLPERVARLAYANLPKCVVPGPKGEPKEADAFAEWLNWHGRSEAGRLVYLPQQPGKPFERLSLAASGDPWHSTWNVWPGWARDPAEDHARVAEHFLPLVDHVFTGAEPGIKEWFLQWLAYPLRYPGTKLFTAVIIHGAGQGTGKTLLGETMRSVYGQNFTEIGNEELKSNFNEWAAGKQFILGDEIAGSDKREFADRIKRMITQTMIRVNPKGLPAYELADCANFFFTSNHGNAFSLSDKDRRCLVHKVIAPPLDEDFYMPYNLWLAEGGGAALFHYLLTQVDLKGFNPKAPAPMTSAKAQMIEYSRSDVESWAIELRDDPDTVLGSHPHFKVRGDLWTPAELLQAYDPDEKTRVKARGLGLALDGVLPKVNGGRQVRGPDGKQYYYAVRNVELWAAADVEAIKAHLENPKSGPATGVVTTSSRRAARKY